MLRSLSRRKTWEYKEDEFLKENLPGYSRYAGIVRDRLIPGLW